MVRVKYYTFEADTHCISCAKSRFECTIPDLEGFDENDIPYSATDREGNNIGAVFFFDNLNEDDERNVLPIVCGTCREVIHEP